MKHYQIMVHDDTVGNRIPQGEASRYSDMVYAGNLRALCSLKLYKDHRSENVHSAIVLITSERAQAIRNMNLAPGMHVTVTALDAESVRAVHRADWVVERTPKADDKYDTEPIRNDNWGFAPLHWMKTGATYEKYADFVPPNDHDELYQLKMVSGWGLDGIGMRHDMRRHDFETDAAYRARLLNKVYGL